MTSWPEIDEIGKRIAIIGPSCAGKSTLAHNLGARLGYPVTHLDQIHHLPNTDWQPRNKTDFIADHDALIQQDEWVMEGNYSSAMPQRFERADTVIWIDPPLLGFLYRYIRRSFFNTSPRHGKLTGATNEFSWKMIYYGFFHYPSRKSKYSKILQQFDGHLIRLPSMRGLNKLYDHWGLQRAS